MPTSKAPQSLLLFCSSDKDDTHGKPESDSVASLASSSSLDFFAYWIERGAYWIEREGRAMYAYIYQIMMNRECIQSKPNSIWWMTVVMNYSPS